MRLSQLHHPQQLKTLSLLELEDLANQIRLFLIESISKTGGHLSSNLGVIELTLALHTVFDSPKDKIIFDVGHQSYPHKLITNRLKAFSTLRQYKGLSGFQKRRESEHDPWEAGHSSTAISAGLGFAVARDLTNQNYEVISVVGDGSLANGMSLEALNDLGAQKRKMIIVFNDNNMSISPNRGGIESSITRLRLSNLYRTTKRDLYESLSSSDVGKEILDFLRYSRDRLKERMIDAPLFTQFNVDYLGPIDGHNIGDLIRAFQTAKEHDGPIVVHVITTKGQGYPYAQDDRTGVWHGVAPFDIASGQFKTTKKTDSISWSQLITRVLIRLAAQDKRICAITPAMATGSALLPFAQKYPKRFFDVGIAEEHAITMAGAMAAGGLQPFVSIYSTFLQRGYDQVLHDVARMDLPVVFGIDRAGLVGADGETHQGIYDIAFLSTIPNVIVCQPKDACEAQNLLYTGFACRHPFFIRYPKGNVSYRVLSHLEEIPIGSWTKTVIGNPLECKQIIIAYGQDVDRIIERARQEKRCVIVVNARFFKPIDTTMLDELIALNRPMIVYETDSAQGGLSTAIAAYLGQNHPHFSKLSLRDGFVEQGTIFELRQEQHITMDDLFQKLDTQNLEKPNKNTTEKEKRDAT